MQHYVDRVPPQSDKSIFSSNGLCRNNRLPSWRQSPAARAKRLIQYSPILDLGQVDYAVGLDLDFVRMYRGQQSFGSFGRECLGGETMERARPVDLAIAFV